MILTETIIIRIFARLMDTGKLLKARISRIEQKGPFTQIAVGIYLVDFLTLMVAA